MDTMAGITSLDRPMPSEQVWVPQEVEVVGDDLIWAPSGEQFKSPGFRFGMLDEFRSLHTAESADLAAYARKWGVLGLCEHGLPWQHLSTIFSVQYGVKGCELRPASCRPGSWFLDSIAAWRRLSLAADAVLRLAAMIEGGAAFQSDECWKRLLTAGPTTKGGIPEWPSRSTNAKRRAYELLAQEIETWLAVGKTVPRCSWKPPRKGRDDGTRFRMTLGSRSWPNLFPVLALKLMLAVSTEGGFAFCSTCPRSYVPERRPSGTRNNYCPACREDGTMWRSLKRQQRARQ